jgi:hypothetical protein
MPNLVPRLNAHRYMHATMTACGWQTGWRSLLLGLTLILLRVLPIRIEHLL